MVVEQQREEGRLRGLERVEELGLRLQAPGSARVLEPEPVQEQERVLVSGRWRPVRAQWPGADSRDSLRFSAGQLPGL